MQLETIFPNGISDEELISRTHKEWETHTILASSRNKKKNPKDLINIPPKNINKWPIDIQKILIKSSLITRVQIKMNYEFVHEDSFWEKCWQEWRGKEPRRNCWWDHKLFHVIGNSPNITKIIEFPHHPAILPGTKFSQEIKSALKEASAFMDSIETL